VTGFRGSVGIDIERVKNFYNNAANHFQPFVKITGSHYKDQDARVFAALALSTGLLTTPETSESFDNLSHFLAWAYRRCIRGGWNPYMDGERTMLPATSWVRQELEAELRKQTFLLKHKRGCIVPEYRKAEEAVLLDRAQQKKCCINGHIVNLIKHAVRDELALPIAISDRPGISVGLKESLSGKAKPDSRFRSLITAPLRIVYET
jgi:hypothetical protein